MNPQLDHTPGLGLPQPSFDMGQSPAGHTPETFRAPETVSPRFEAGQPPMPNTPAQAAIQQPMQPVAQQPVQQQPAMLTAAQAQDVSAALQSDDNETALDEEWIAKAREIVERTHADPYLQSREISKIKAQYIKARYNKDIKNVED